MKKMYILCIAIITLSDAVFGRFENLDELERFVQTLPADPVSDNDDWVDPDFTSFYKSLEPGFFSSILIDLGFSSLKFDVMRLKEPLLRAIKSARQVIKVRPYIKELKVAQETRFVFFGDLHTAIQSFTRSLRKLEKEGLIDNQFSVRGDSTYIVFLGDVINRGVYSFELLEVILKLMERNPERVIYLRGRQEEHSYWKSFFAMRVPLKRWQLFWGSRSMKQHSIEKELDSFFEILPDILCIRSIAGGNNKGAEKIYCAHSPVENALLKEKGVQAMIAGDFAHTIQKYPSGLYFGGVNEGVAEWSMLSSPIHIYQKHLGFFNDSFCILTLGEKFSDGLLTHFYRDIRTKEDFKQKQYQVALGYEIDKTHPQKPTCVIPLCSSLVLSGPVRAIGRGCANGFQAAVAQLNDEGGRHGCFFKPVLYDDFYDPLVTVKNIKKIVTEWKTDIILAPTGSPTLTAYLDQVASGAVSVFFPLTGGPQFRLPSLEHIVHVRRSYVDEVRCLIKHLIKTYGSKRFAIVYQNDAFGNPLVKAAREELLAYGHSPKDLIEVPFSREQISFKDEALKVRAGNPEAIALFFGSSNLASNFLVELGATFPIGKHLFATSILDDEAFRFVLKGRGIKFTFSYIVPDSSSDLPLLKDYKRAMEKFNYSFDSNSLEGYLAGTLIGDAIAHIDPPYTGKRLISYFTSFKNYQFKGLSLTFDPQTRSLLLPVWVKSEKGELELYSLPATQPTAQKKPIQPESKKTAQKIATTPATLKKT